MVSTCVLLATAAAARTLRGMVKRMTAAVLWLFAGWYLGNALAFLVGVPDLLGPILGVAAAFVFAVDPQGWIWKRPAAEPVAVATTDRTTATAEPAA